MLIRINSLKRIDRLITINRSITTNRLTKIIDRDDIHETSCLIYEVVALVATWQRHWPDERLRIVGTLGSKRNIDPKGLNCEDFLQNIT
jgi:hypothetical protein